MLETKINKKQILLIEYRNSTIGLAQKQKHVKASLEYTF